MQQPSARSPAVSCITAIHLSPTCDQSYLHQDTQLIATSQPQGRSIVADFLIIHHAADLSTSTRPAKMPRQVRSTKHFSHAVAVVSHPTFAVPSDHFTWNLETSMVSLELPVSATASSKRLTCREGLGTCLWLRVGRCWSTFALLASCARCLGARACATCHPPPRRSNMQDRGCLVCHAARAQLLLGVVPTFETNARLPRFLSRTGSPSAGLARSERPKPRKASSSTSRTLDVTTDPASVIPSHHMRTVS